MAPKNNSLVHNSYNNNNNNNNNNWSYVLWDNKPGFVLSLFLNFFAKTKAFVLIIKLFLQKKSVEDFEKII